MAYCSSLVIWLTICLIIRYSYSNLSSTPLHHLLPPSFLLIFINKRSHFNPLLLHSIPYANHNHNHNKPHHITNTMQCSICTLDKPTVTCVSCARGALWLQRYDLLLQTAARDTLSDKIHEHLESLSGQTATQQRESAQLQLTLHEIHNQKASLATAREAAMVRVEELRRENERRRAVLEEAMGLRDRLEAEVSSVQRETKRWISRSKTLHGRVAEARGYLCREAAGLYGLRQKRRKSGRVDHVIGGVAIPNYLTDLNSTPFLIFPFPYPSPFALKRGGGRGRERGKLANAGIYSTHPPTNNSLPLPPLPPPPPNSTLPLPKTPQRNPPAHTIPPLHSNPWNPKRTTHSNPPTLTPSTPLHTLPRQPGLSHEIHRGHIPPRDQCSVHLLHPGV